MINKSITLYIFRLCLFLRFGVCDRETEAEKDEAEGRGGAKESQREKESACTAEPGVA